MDESPAPRFRRGLRAATDRLRSGVSFPLAVRGYDRRAVDEFVDEMRELVAELESRQTRESVVQRALDELGEETASILQRAHETADDIAARSRAQAEGRLQRADREAEILRREADAYAEQVVVETRLLWDERQRLIEEIRGLADEVLALADDAMERVKLPEGLMEDTTTEVPLTPLPGGLGSPGLQAPDPDPTPEPELLDEADDDEPLTEYGVAVTPETDPAEDAGPHTVELEALPGGAAENEGGPLDEEDEDSTGAEWPAEPERR
jgi:hypothetical protein